MNSNLLDFRQNRKFCDAVLIVDDVEFDVHKLILSSASDVFLGMFTTEMEKGRSSRMKIDDVEPVIFEEFLHYIYANTSPKLSQFPIKMLALADKYAVQDLILLTESYLMEMVDTTNVTEYLLAAHRLNRSTLKVRLFEFVRTNLSNIVGKEGWKEVENDFDLMTELCLSFPEISSKNEIENRLKQDVVWVFLNDISDEETRSPIFKIRIDNDVLQFRFRLIKKKRSLDVIILNRPQKYIWELVTDYSLRSPSGDDLWISSKNINWDKSITIETIVNLMDVKDNLRMVFTMNIREARKDGLLKTRSKIPIVSRPLSSDTFDVSFKIGSRVFDGHRAILTDKSHFFDDLFQNPDRISEPHYVLTETNEKCFEILLNYLYTDDIPGVDDLNLEMLQCADVFSIPTLFETIERHIADNLKAEDAIPGLIVADKLGSKSIRDEALKLIASNVKFLSDSKEKWSQLSKYPHLMSALLGYLEKEIEFN